MRIADRDTLFVGGDRRAAQDWLTRVVAVLVVAGLFGAWLLTSHHPHRRTKRQLVPDGGWSTTVDYNARNATFVFQIHNPSSASMTIFRAGRSGHGLRLLSSSAAQMNTTRGPLVAGGDALPVTAAPHSTMAVSLMYHVAHCRVDSGRNWPIPLTYRFGTSKKQTLAFSPGAGGPVWQTTLTRGICSKPPLSSR